MWLWSVQNYSKIVFISRIQVSYCYFCTINVERNKLVWKKRLNLGSHRSQCFNLVTCLLFINEGSTTDWHLFIWKTAISQRTMPLERNFSVHWSLGSCYIGVICNRTVPWFGNIKEWKMSHSLQLTLTRTSKMSGNYYWHILHLLHLVTHECRG